MQLMSEALVKQAQGHRTNQPLNVAHFVAARDLFSQEAPGLRDNALVEMLRRDFADANVSWRRGPVLYPGSDVRAYARNMGADGKIDAAIVVLGNYGCEKEVEALLAALRVPALIAAPYDGPPDSTTGRRLYDAFCGVQPMSKLIADRGHPYLVAPYATLESYAMHEAIDRFVRVARAVRNVTNETLLCIGTPCATFDAIKVSELALASQFGTTVEWVELHTYFGMIERLLAGEQAMLDAEVAATGERVDTSRVPPEALRRIAAAKIAMLQLMVEKKADGITHRCWPEVVQGHLMHCMVSGEILDLGEGVACETDLPGLKSVLMLKGFGLERPPIFADITIALPVVEEGRIAGPGDAIHGWIILIWHCGPFPPSICKNCCGDRGWIVPTGDDEPAWAILDGVINAPGETVTLARLGAYGPNGDGFSFNALEMPLVEGPKTIGTHGYGYIAGGNGAFQKLFQRLTVGDRDWGASDTVHHFGGLIAPEGVGDLVMDVARLVKRPFRTLGPDDEELLARRRCSGFHPLTPWQP
jgi:L-fucose isomerase-like protein